MRIVNLVTQMEPGGAQAVALDLASGFRTRGHDAETWFLYEKSSIAAECTHVFGGVRPTAFSQVVSLLADLREMLIWKKPDVVIGFTHYANVIGAAMCAIARVPVFVASQHNPPSSYPSHARIADLIAGTLGMYTRNVHCAPSVRAAFNSYPRRYLSTVRVVSNGVRFSKSTLTQAQAKQQFCLDPESALMVAVGRLAVQKNHEILLQVLRRQPAVHLAIAGEGDLRAHLNTAAIGLGVDSRLHLLGVLEKPRIADLLRAGDMFVMPSLFEGMSVALIEAMQEGLPILSSAAPAQLDVLTLDDGQLAGRALPANDPSAWVAAVSDLLEDRAERRRLASLALRRGSAFNVETMVDNYLTELTELGLGTAAAEMRGETVRTPAGRQSNARCSVERC